MAVSTASADARAPSLPLLAHWKGKGVRGREGASCAAPEVPSKRMPLPAFQDAPKRGGGEEAPPPKARNSLTTPSQEKPSRDDRPLARLCLNQKPGGVEGGGQRTLSFFSVPTKFGRPVLQRALRLKASSATRAAQGSGAALAWQPQANRLRAAAEGLRRQPEPCRALLAAPHPSQMRS